MVALASEAHGESDAVAERVRSDILTGEPDPVGAAVAEALDDWRRARDGPALRRALLAVLADLG